MDEYNIGDLVKLTGTAWGWVENRNKLVIILDIKTVEEYGKPKYLYMLSGMNNYWDFEEQFEIQLMGKAYV